MPDDLQPVCEVHGPMHYRFGRKAWVCMGFDGEGCGSRESVLTMAGMTDEAVHRVGSGQTYWPGVRVVATDAG